ncbi:MAG: hypothetical protein FJ279_34765, partial [Planctomycetes bacterium]|nr:hypothetical protein [Planctomycetota bacterium]
MKAYALRLAWLVLFLSPISWAQEQKLVPRDWAWEPLFTVPALKGASRLDGVLADNEWLFATQVGALVDGNTLMQATQRGRFLLGYRGQDFCLGFDFHRPKGSGQPRILVEKAGWSEKPLWVRDENLEVWLAPFTE